MAGPGWGVNAVVPGLTRDPYAAAVVVGKKDNDYRANDCRRWLWVPAQGRDDTEYVAAQSAYIFITACRSIFPVPVFGNSPTNVISRGYLYGNIFALT